ncbi:MAG: TonB-dependent receptor, partial [Muribaculaceae bacterium]|nr:TonB-dependent receptor [Muribaculaceae bacterium]
RVRRQRQMCISVRFTIGGYGYYNPFLRLEGRVRNVELSGNAEYIHARNDYPFKLKNGNIVTREKRQNSQMNLWKGEINARWRIKNDASLAGKIYFYDNSRHLPGPVIYYVTESNERLRERNYFSQLNFRSRLHDKISFSAIAKFNWSSTRYQDEAGKYPGGRLDDYYIQREVYASGALLYLPIEGLSLDYSADWFLNNLTSASSRNAVSPYRNGILQSIAAKYNAGKFSFLGKLLYSVYLNGAKSGDAGKDCNRLSPSFGITWKPFAQTGFFVRASYKNIFRMPTFNEAYFNNYGSINLQPEITDQFDLGLTFEKMSDGFLNSAAVTVDGYFNIVSNKIVALPYNMFLWTMSNLGKVNVKGLDVTVSATFRLSDRHDLLLAGSYSYQRAEVRTSPDRYDWKKQLAYLPLNSGSGSLTWENPWVDIVFHATASGSRYTTNNNLPETKLPGYVDSGLSLLKKIVIGKYTLSGRVDILNIFDTRYEIVARYPMPGRTWKCGVSFEF